MGKPWTFLFYLTIISEVYGFVNNTYHRTIQSCSADCVIPSGEIWMVDQNVDVNTITVHGILKWDTSKPDITLRTNGLLVEQGGLFELGTDESPMMEKATIYIKDPHDQPGASHPNVGQRYLAVLGDGKISLRGRPLERTWSELDRDHEAGSTELYLRDDPVNMGWRVGDRIGVATTSRGESTLHKITEIKSNYVKLDSPLKSVHWGGFREIQGYRFWMAAEVINMERSIVITGDSDRFAAGFGWHGGAFMEAPVFTGKVGIYTTKYVRMEQCGQLDVLGRYCVHLHVIRDCEDCIVEGNAFVESYQSAVTLHGVNKALIDKNVGWDNRGVGLYTEDGNEMYNMISNNVFICHDIFYCRIEWQNSLGVGPAQKEGGIFMFGMKNDVIGNHVVGHEHGIWTEGASQPDGRPFGFSNGLVCNQHTPFGKIQGNVFHDCQRFGSYFDFQYPRNVIQDENGLVSKMPFGPKPSCDEFMEDGTDNGHVNLIEDQFDWHNTFVGGYFMGDISFVRYTSVNNDHALYWKFSKNFAKSDAYHVKDSIIVNDPNDMVHGQLKVMLPGGSFSFRMKNVTFAGGPFLPGGGVLNTPQHCGLGEYNHGTPGAKCNVEVLLENVDFSGVLPDHEGKKVLTFFGASEGNPVAPIYISKDDSLGGYQSVVSNYLNGFENVPGCSGPNELYNGYVCDESVKIRRLTVWAPDMGDLTLKGPGYDVAPNFNHPVLGNNGGIMHYEIDQNHVPSHTKLLGGGYAANVVIGEEYTLEGLHWVGEDIVVEVSEPFLAEHFGVDKDKEGIFLTLQVSDGSTISCFPNAGESRKFHGSDHIDQRALRSNNMGECSVKFRESAGEALKPTMPTIPPSGDCGCPGAEYDESCAGGGIGCSACGKDFCRYCGGNGFPPCKYGSTTQGLPTTTEQHPTQPTQSSTQSSQPTQTTPSSTTIPTSAPPNPGCGCDGAEYDSRCSDPSSDPFGGLGCSACGKKNCRFCGNTPFPDCSGGNQPTSQQTSTAAPPSPDKCDCNGAGYDERCENPSTDPFGGLGCMACGIPKCRFCGTDNLPPCL